MAFAEDPLSLVFAAQVTRQCLVTLIQEALLQDRVSLG